MKFKYLVIIFNIIIVFFLSVAALLPFVVFGSGFSALFWRSAWPLALVLMLALAFLNVFFARNYRLYKLLEREDWPALVDHLEQRVIGKAHYSSRMVRLLANSYLVMNEPPAVLRLENKVGIAKPALIEGNALIFGAARILGGDPIGAAGFFKTRLEKTKRNSPDAQWIRWYMGFSYVLAGVFENGEEEFRRLVVISGDTLITGLSAYFLGTTLTKYSANSAECASLAAQGRDRVKQSAKTPEHWKKEAARVETEVHAAIIKKYIDEAEDWLFKR